MINVNKRFQTVYYEINDKIVTDNPASKQLLKLFYLEGLVAGVELSSDKIEASQMKEIVAEILKQKK